MLARVLACITCLAIAGWRLEISPGGQNDDGLRSFSTALLAAVRKADFDRFASFCGGEVCFTEYEYVFPPKKDRGAVWHWFTPLFHGVGNTGRQAKAVHEYKMHCYVWPSQTHRDVIARHLFRNLVREVQNTADSFPDGGIRVGEAVLVEVPTSGQGIWGEIASDEYWRIEVSRVAGHWRVSVVEMGVH